MIRLLAILSIFGSISASAQRPQWGNLSPGPHAIGYKVLQYVDHSRTYLDRPRVLQFYLWYPATQSGKSCTYGDYLKDAVNDLPADHPYHEIIKKEVETSFKNGALNPSFGTSFNDKDYQKVMSTPIPSRK